MGKETRTKLYIGIVLISAGLVSAATLTTWQIQPSASDALVMLLVSGLVFIASRYPFKLSPQAEASLFTVPLFMGALLLHPAEAAVAGTAGLLVSEALLRRPIKVVVFNASVTLFMVALSGAVFWALRPEGAIISFTSAITITAAAATGMTLHFTNLGLIAGMVTIRKGGRFWSTWKETWTIDIAQEGGALVLGFVGALVASFALWAVSLLILPVAMAYIGFRRSVEETRRSVELAQHNASLAEELESRLHELERTQTELIMQSEKLASVGITAASVVHEVKNAMSVTGGRAELLLRHSDLYLKSERAVEHVQGIQEMTSRVTFIVQDLLAYARQEKRQENKDQEPLSITEQMNVAAGLVSKRAISQGVAIVKDFKAAPMVDGIANQFQQVFMNLLINSIDATPSGGSITLGCEVEGEKVLASVTDTGVGIPEKALPQIFEPFFTTKEEGKGTGLGMFVCQKIVADHNGQIAINSKEGVGTEITISLPLHQNEQNELLTKSQLDEAMADLEKMITVRAAQNTNFVAAKG